MIEIQMTTDNAEEAQVINSVLREADDGGFFNFAFNTEVINNVVTITVEDEGEKNVILECLEEAEQDGQIEFAFETMTTDVGSTVFPPTEEELEY